MRHFVLLLCLSTAAFAQEYGTNHRMKIKISGQTRKGVFFLPKGARKGQVMPLLITIPTADGKAFREIGQWQRDAYDNGFALFSVDIVTSLQRGWHPSETADMQRDMEAVVEGLKEVKKLAKENNVTIDESAVVITGHSGGTYLTLWLAVRRPDLFLGVCGRGVVFFEETVAGYKGEKVPHDPSLRVFVYHGEFDARRAKDGTKLAAKMLKDKGYRHVRLQIVEKMKHESKPEVCLEWFVALLKETARGRGEAVRIGKDIEKLAADLAKGRRIYGKLVKLVEREKKAGFGTVAQAMLKKAEAKAKKDMAHAADLEADGKLDEAMAALKAIEKKYAGLAVMKTARTKRTTILKSDEYKARGMLQKAQKWIKKGQPDKANPILQKIIEDFPKTASAEEAKSLLKE